jgi:signal transduction histidine kinase
VALDQAAAELRLALAELRELARGIHPVILSEAGLGPALASLAERSPIPVTLTAVPPDRLPARLEETAYDVATWRGGRPARRPAARPQPRPGADRTRA